MKHLKRLKDGRIFSIEDRKDGTFLIWEECDNNFATAELRELAQEILDVANGGACG